MLDVTAPAPAREVRNRRRRSSRLRRGTLGAIHHARHRSAFGALLAGQPAMRNVLADLAVESEARRSPRSGSRAPTTRTRRRRSDASGPR